MSLNDPNWGRNAGQKSDSDQGSRRPKNNDGPPDLDELWRDFNRRLSSLFGGRGGDPGNSGGNRPGTPFGNPFGSNLNAGIGLGVLLALMLLLWLGSGFYIVQEGQAAVVMRFMDDTGVPHEKINVNGGAIALGHPLGATGAIILGTALDELERRGLSTALVTLCVGAGMGTATIIERV